MLISNTHMLTVSIRKKELSPQHLMKLCCAFSLKFQTQISYTKTGRRLTERSEMCCLNNFFFRFMSSLFCISINGYYFQKHNNFKLNRQQLSHIRCLYKQDMIVDDNGNRNTVIATVVVPVKSVQHSGQFGQRWKKI